MPCRQAGHVPAGSSTPHGCSQRHRDLLGPAISRGQPRKSAGCPDYRSTSLHRFAGIPPGPCRGSQKLMAKRPGAGTGLGLGWQESTSAGRASGQISLGLQTASRPAVHLCPAYRSGFWLGIGSGAGTQKALAQDPSPSAGVSHRFTDRQAETWAAGRNPVSKSRFEKPLQSRGRSAESPSARL